MCGHLVSGRETHRARFADPAIAVEVLRQAQVLSLALPRLFTDSL